MSENLGIRCTQLSSPAHSPVALTKTEKRATREHKSSYIQEVREAIDKYDGLYLFSYENMRSSKFKNVRMEFRDDGRIFLGKNKLLQIALGRTTEDEYQDNLRHVAKRITGGSVGLLFTSKKHAEVQNYFATLDDPDFARAGALAPRDVMISSDRLLAFPVSMMEQFRKLGLPLDIANGTLVFRDGKDEHRICKQGETLSAEKGKLLVHFDVKLANFKVRLVCRWCKGEFEVLDDSSTMVVD